MGKIKHVWQDDAYVLHFIDAKRPIARHRYRQFIKKGLSQGRRDDLMGGGLIRSSGGWSTVKALRKANAHVKSDDRILGNSDFVGATELAPRLRISQPAVSICTQRGEQIVAENNYKLEQD